MKKNAKQTEAEEYKTGRKMKLSIIWIYLCLHTKSLFIVVSTTY